MTYECQDEPEKTKVEILIRKQDAETGKGQAQAGLSLAGAEFHVAFFDSIFDNQNEIGVKVPLRSWKLKSDADGVVRMDEAHLISGDPSFRLERLRYGRCMRRKGIWWTPLHIVSGLERSKMEAIKP